MDYQEYLAYEGILTKRAYASLCDYLCYFGICVGYFFFVATTLENGVLTTTLFPHVFVLFIVWLIWIPGIESWTGSTLFKSVFKIKVIFRDGKRPTLETALTRHLFDPIDLLLSFGIVALVLARTTRNHQRIGDMVARTYVVRADSSNLRNS
jgi:uncharacterized RDD family membrane protein YckC